VRAPRPHDEARASVEGGRPVALRDAAAFATELYGAGLLSEAAVVAQQRAGARPGRVPCVLARIELGRRARPANRSSSVRGSPPGELANRVMTGAACGVVERAAPRPVADGWPRACRTACRRSTPARAAATPTDARARPTDGTGRDRDRPGKERREPRAARRVTDGAAPAPPLSALHRVAAAEVRGN
jgi:hypothetical protein